MKQEKKHRFQRTIKRPVEYTGIGIHTCAEVRLVFCPAKENTGIVFQRTDLPSSPLLPAHLDYVIDTTRNTTLGKDSFRIHTVEHVLAAVNALKIDNLLIQISDHEPPVADGSSLEFIHLLKKAGIVFQSEEAQYFSLDTPLFFSEDPVYMVALPFNGFKISYTLHYPEEKSLQTQYFSSEINEEIFEKEIAPCRTFSMYREVAFLMEKGLIKGGSLQNGVVIKDEAILSKGGLRFQNEPARHKVLDMIGDFSLLGVDLFCHLIAIRGGHTSNFSLAKILYQHMMQKKSYFLKKEKKRDPCPI